MTTRAFARGRVATGWIIVAAALAAPNAHAGGVDGTSVPPFGGGWSGFGDPGARGVLFNPTASGSGEAPEVLFDVGVIGIQIGYWPDTNDEPLLLRVPVPQPTITVAVPLGDKFGLGTYVHAPYVRSDFTSGVLLIETGAVGSWRVSERLTLAGGVRLGVARVGATVPLDTGVLVNDNLPLDEDLRLPEGDPFLQGDQLVPTRNTWTASPVVAATVHLPQGTQLHAVFRPPWVINARSTVSLRPSNDLAALLTGDVSVRVPFPMRIAAAATIPLGRLTLLPEVEYVGWRRASMLGLDLDNLRIVSSDPLFDEVLGSVGLAEADFLDVAEVPQQFDLLWRDVVHPAVQAQYRLSDEVDLRAGVLLANAAVSRDVLSEFNLDFTTVALRAGAAWRTSDRVRLSGTVEWFASPSRVVRDSAGQIASFYDLQMWRAGITTQLFFGRRTQGAASSSTSKKNSVPSRSANPSVVQAVSPGAR